MQELMMGTVTGALQDPRLQGLVADFHAVRPKLTVRHEAPLKSAIAALLETICCVLADHSSVHAAEGRGAEADSLDDAASCIQGMQDLALAGPFFNDVVAVLWLFRSKLGIDTVKDPEEVVRRLDDFLVLIGITGVSVHSLWLLADGDFADHRERIWGAVDATLCTVAAEVAVKGSPSVRSSQQRNP
jgi:hypothetical protein